MRHQQGQRGHRDQRVKAVEYAAMTGDQLARILDPGAALVAGTADAPITLLALFIAGLKGGLLTFGGAYTAIPYVRSDTVGRGWVSASGMARRQSSRPRRTPNSSMR